MIALAAPPQTSQNQLGVLHDRYHRPLMNYLIKLTLGDRQIAEDILQETFLRAWRHLERHDEMDIDAFRPWLYTVARRLVVDMLRARRARPTEVILDDMTRLPVTEDTIGTLLGIQAVREALLRLRPDHRHVLIELYYHGRSPGEVAAQLDIPVGTVKSRSHYARNVLRSLLSE